MSSLVEKDDVAILLPLMWHEQANKALDKLKLLEDDWDSYGADAPNLQSIRTARIVLYVAAEMGFEPISIDASVEGGVCISWLNGDRYGDIESFNSEELFAVNSSPADPAKAWEVESTLAGLRTAIERIRAFLNR
ncbi:MAG: hypothetical protein SGJ20_16865 [Planctomycetota bacterium]|nr:hypothetical protein [Planctomycetota bacterium]